MFKKSAGALASRRRVKKDEVDESTGDSVMNGSTDTKTSAALLRIQKDFADLELPDNVTLTKGSDDFNYSFTVHPNTGYWKGGAYEFRFVFPSSYPFSGMKVTCVDKIYHPNIDVSDANPMPRIAASHSQAAQARNNY
jgi:ubiquitin-conjugating enzyme E2 M